MWFLFCVVFPVGGRDRTGQKCGFCFVLFFPLGVGIGDELNSLDWNNCREDRNSCCTTMLLVTSCKATYVRCMRV